MSIASIDIPAILKALLDFVQNGTKSDYAFILSAFVLFGGCLALIAYLNVSTTLRAFFGAMAFAALVVLVFWGASERGTSAATPAVEVVRFQRVDFDPLKKVRVQTSGKFERVGPRHWHEIHDELSANGGREEHYFEVISVTNKNIYLLDDRRSEGECVTLLDIDIRNGAINHRCYGSSDIVKLYDIVQLPV